VNIEPLRETLLAEAKAEAAALLERAARERAGRISAAEQQAAALIAEARSLGLALGEREAGHVLGRARRRSTEVVLGSKKSLLEEARQQALAAVRALPAEPGYPQLVERLERAARAQLGEDAAIAVDLGLGGVRGRRGSRSVDYTLPVLVERCLEQLDEKLAEAWR
jgi:vacuolar-type H+-ATPase subunit E/Vma4